jgi:hypothetical protein
MKLLQEWLIRIAAETQLICHSRVCLAREDPECREAQ